MRYQRSGEIVQAERAILDIEIHQRTLTPRSCAASTQGDVGVVVQRVTRMVFPGVPGAGDRAADVQVSVVMLLPKMISSSREAL